MVKLMIAFAIASMIFVAFAQDSEDCQNEIMGPCSRFMKCCKPYVCWVDGKCDMPYEPTVSVASLLFEIGKVTQYEKYDKCPDHRSREGEWCQTDRDCCMPLDCKIKTCVAPEGYDRVLEVLRGD